MVDDRPRIWLNPATSTGLLFSCRQGEVRTFAFFLAGFRKMFYRTLHVYLLFVVCQHYGSLTLHRLNNICVNVASGAA